MKRGVGRKECFRLLGRLIGAEAIPQFLRTRQPALEDKTGAELLQADPAALLKRLKELEKEAEGMP